MRCRQSKRITLPEVLLAFAVVCVVDAVAPSPGDSLGLAGILDEMAHAATAVLVLSLTRLDILSMVAVLVGAVAIDVDHVPALLGWDGLTEGSARPYSHSLATVLAIALVALFLQGKARGIALCLGLGVSIHLWRDLSTGSGGVPLLWPIDRDSVIVPYLVYVGLLAALVAEAFRRHLSAARSHSAVP